MKVKLLHHSPLWLASHGIRMSHDNHDKGDRYNTDDNIGNKDRDLVARVGNKLKHKSVLEQLVYWFDIDGISRACLQELARHRTARLVVKSSRYTLKELFINNTPSVEFIVLTGNAEVDNFNIQTVDQFRALIAGGNDTIKYAIPEAFKTRLQWQIDMRNYQAFLELRLDKSALWEIRELAYATYKALPPEHRYLVNDIIMNKGYEVC